MSKIKIPFNKIHTTGSEMDYFRRVIESGNLSSGDFTIQCKKWLEEKYGFSKTCLTTSCTDALELAALLLEIEPGDEIIAPSYTFVSTVNPFVLRGAKIVFADSNSSDPNINAEAIEALITNKTKAIIVVHYGGVMCDMDKIMALAGKHYIEVIEDAAHALDSFYYGKPAGSFGKMAAFSFHSTKNITCGEGGLLVLNDPSLTERAGILSEKGTNRNEFVKGNINKYDWVDIGSSFLLSEIHAGFLFAQLENLDKIQVKRIDLWNQYLNSLATLQEKGIVQMAKPVTGITGNAHLFYLVCSSHSERNKLIEFLRSNGIASAFHYTALHESPYFGKLHDGRALPMATKYANCLLRLPLYYDLEPAQVELISHKVIEFFKS